VKGDRVHEMDFMPKLGEPERIGPGTSADVADDGVMSGQEPENQLLGTLELQLPTDRAEPGPLASDSRVVSENLRSNRRRLPRHGRCTRAATIYVLSGACSKGKSAAGGTDILVRIPSVGVRPNH